MSAPIINEINIVKEICSTAKQSSDISLKINNYKKYSEILKEVQDDFLDNVKEYNVIKKIVPSIKDEIKECFSQYKNSFLSLIENIEKDSVNNQMFIALKGLNTNFERIINISWRNYVELKLNSIIRTIGVFQDFIGRSVFYEINNDYKRILVSNPTEEMVKDIDFFCEKGEKIISGMNADDDIILFISKVSSGNATLNDLNDKIIKWIKEHNYLNKIKITM